MGKAADRMRRVLNDTGIYSLTGDSPADWELNACDAGFALLEAAVDDLLERLFAATAPADQLDRWEALCRPQPSVGSLEDRRTLTGARLAVNPRRFTPEDYADLLPAAGVVGTVTEESGSLRVTPVRLLGISETEVRAELDRLLPAHLPWSWDNSQLS